MGAGGRGPASGRRDIRLRYVSGLRCPGLCAGRLRGAAAHVQQSIQPDETIILCSGHMFPVWDLYAPGMERHLLPDSPTLDTTRLLDYSIASELNSWLSGKGGVWLVLWQDEVVDLRATYRRCSRRQGKR